MTVRSLTPRFEGGHFPCSSPIVPPFSCNSRGFCSGHRPTPARFACFSSSMCQRCTRRRQWYIPTMYVCGSSNRGRYYLSYSRCVDGSFCLINGLCSMCFGQDSGAASCGRYSVLVSLLSGGIGVPYPLMCCRNPSALLDIGITFLFEAPNESSGAGTLVHSIRPGYGNPPSFRCQRDCGVWRLR